MSNEDFFTRYSSELLVLNGLDYSVNNHSPCSRYMATGKLDSLAYPTFAALVAACNGPSCPLAFLTFGNYSATGNLVAMARIPYLPSLKLIANADHVSGIEQHPYHDSFVLDRIDQALKSQSDARLSEIRLPRTERAQGYALCRADELISPSTCHPIHTKIHPQRPPHSTDGNRLGLL